MAYVKHVANQQTPQMEQAREDQIENSAGGYVFKITDWDRLDRFLILGCEKGTYYATERKLTIENFKAIEKLLFEDGKRVVDRIVKISQEGRAPKNAPAVFALAIASIYGDLATRTYANKNVSKVCRYSTDLFSWVNSVVELKEGRKSKGLQRAIGRWYNEQTSSQIAYQVCKYPGRSVDKQRWTHRDLLRIFRPGTKKKADPALTTASTEHGSIFRYVVKGKEVFDELEENAFKEIFGDNENLKYIYGHEMAKVATKSSEVIPLISKYGLTRESIPNNLFDASIWKALLPHMPMTALIRNLGRMTMAEVFKPLSDETSFVADKITNEEILKKARIHPMSILLALKIYTQGGGIRSDWKPVGVISDALEKAFYLAFKNVEPTGKKIMAGIDVSGSMWWSHCIGSEILNAGEAAAVIAMAIARKEKNHYMKAFSDKLIDLDFRSNITLETLIQKMKGIEFGGTDCSLPILHAIEKKIDVDAFIVLTDSETWAGRVHPFEALKSYRKKFNPNAKMIVAAFSATDFSIADPKDAGMMDVVGLDSSTPQIISDFIAGRI